MAVRQIVKLTALFAVLTHPTFYMRLTTFSKQMKAAPSHSSKH